MMQKHISFEIAKELNKLGYSEKSEYLYCNIRNGLRAVLGDPKNPQGERIYYEGDLCHEDKEWGVEYPSAYWIPAPLIYDVINWFESEHRIYITTDLNYALEFIYKIYVNGNQEYQSDDSFKTSQECYRNAINKVIILLNK